MRILTPCPHPIPTAREEQSKWLQAFLDRAEPESDTLDYKSGRGLGKFGVKGKIEDEAKDEFTKDLCAMANSAGGLILHGVDEEEDQYKIKRPLRLSPVDSKIMTQERLSQIAEAIMPSIPGLRIVPIEPAGLPGLQCFAIEIPQSSTIHQARDFRYHRRANATTYRMRDFEIREALNRQTFPAIRAWVHFTHPRVTGAGSLNIEVENVGDILCRDYHVQLTLPYYLPFWSGGYCYEIPEIPRIRVNTPRGSGIRLGFTGREGVLHPGMRQNKEFAVLAMPKDDFKYQGVLPLQDYCLLEIFADSAPRSSRWFLFDAFLRGERPSDEQLTEMSQHHS